MPKSKSEFPLQIVSHNGMPVPKRYGVIFPNIIVTEQTREYLEILVEIEAFKHPISPLKGGRGKFGSYKKLCRLLWPWFEWNRWADQMGMAFCMYDRVGLAGCASSGKSMNMSMWGVVNFLANPAKTLVDVISTDKAGAKTRIWSNVKNLATKSTDDFLQRFVLKYKDYESRVDILNKDLANANAGIQLVAAGDEFKDEAVKKLQGSKNDRVIVLFDEAQDCSASVFDAEVNLRKNAYLQIICSGNASNRYDAHGIFCAPKEGWVTVNRNTGSWKIKPNGSDGICLHFPGRKSPNLDEETYDKFPFLYGSEDLAKDMAMGEKDPRFWRQSEGFWPPEGVDDAIYPAAELEKHKATRKDVTWIQEPIKVLGFDPSYTNDGDRFIAYMLKYGQSTEHEHTIKFDYWQEIKQDMGDDETSRNYAMVRKCKELAERLGVPPENVGVDASSANPIGDIFHKEWSPKIMLVNFNGSPSDLPYKEEDPRPCKEVFDRKVSELWFIGREFMSKGQLRGVDVETAREMGIRKYEVTRGNKIKVETKADMKERTNGQSPDLSEGAFIALNVLRERFNVMPGGKMNLNNYDKRIWARMASKYAITPRGQLQTLGSYSKSTKPKTKFGEMFQSN